jgi:hypothetical protein
VTPCRHDTTHGNDDEVSTGTLSRACCHVALRRVVSHGCCVCRHHVSVCVARVVVAAGRVSQCPPHRGKD